MSVTRVSAAAAVFASVALAFACPPRQCPDGSWAPVTDTYEFDANTMSGTRSVFHSAACGMPAGVTKSAFTLAFKEPLPIPVERYPLDCEPGGLRLCR